MAASSSVHPLSPTIPQLACEDMHRKSAGSTTVYHMSKISLWNPSGIFTSCKRLDCIAGPREIKTCLACSLIRRGPQRGPKCSKLGLLKEDLSASKLLLGQASSQTLIFSPGRHLLVPATLPLSLCSPVVQGFLSQLHGSCWQVLMECLNKLYGPCTACPCRLLVSILLQLKLL